MDADLRLRCPICRAIDWSRDGFTMAVDINGELHPIRVTDADPTAAPDTPWECGRCGFHPAYPSDLGHALEEMQQSIPGLLDGI